MSAFNLFRVIGGVCRFGPGDRLALTREQVEPRLSRLKPAGRLVGERVLCSVEEAVEFKIGEVIGLLETFDDLARAVSSLLEPLEPSPSPRSVVKERKRAAPVSQEKPVAQQDEPAVQAVDTAGSSDHASDNPDAGAPDQSLLAGLAS